MNPAEMLELWQDLGNGNRNATGMDRRRLNKTAPVDMFACIYWPSRGPGLLVEGNGEQGLFAGRVPTCRGVRVTHEVLETNSGVRTILRVMLEDQRLLDIFAVLSADLVNVVALERGGASALRRCIDRLCMWQGLLERVPLEGLSDESQRGLFGELMVLEHLQLSALDPLVGVLSWVGPDGAHQDFEIEGLAVEVKTTFTKRRTRLMIANEKQLDERTHHTLLLAHVRLDESATEGITLPDLVSRLRIALQPDPAASREFDLRLMQCGYLDVHAPLYGAHRFRVFGMRIFRVDGDFPRLTEANLPPGVGDIRYTIIADDLSSHEITKETVIELLRSTHE
ncbi:PD-(D/E)XK motif protein [Nitrosovibrio sp. Nv6]|uniref:PD-(D/E)XK motif protein n=1 Tax=Nitrosovibrio sp. Nv6 TaxID=1855340 RepID=UPI0008B64455|nr:PD-(D/E)XK motif protein [Nitrosovibrio sp. Nv6]SEP19390.1 Putative PD-(D/E)XK family member [Nitrosovibrio sp. Nv6]